MLRALSGGIVLPRAEEADGILEPQESERLNFNPGCIQSPIVSRLWALAVLSWASGQSLLVHENRGDLFLPLHPAQLLVT